MSTTAGAPAGMAKKFTRAALLARAPPPARPPRGARRSCPPLGRPPARELTPVEREGADDRSMHDQGQRGPGPETTATERQAKPRERGRGGEHGERHPTTRKVGAQHAAPLDGPTALAGAPARTWAAPPA